MDGRWWRCLYSPTSSLISFLFNEMLTSILRHGVDKIGGDDEADEK